MNILAIDFTKGVHTTMYEMDYIEFVQQQRRECCDYRHVARRRRERRERHFMKIGVRVSWQQGQRVMVAFTPNRISQIGKRWSKH